MSKERAGAAFLGRYEYVNRAKNSEKFYEIHYDSPTDTFYTTWGRIGSGAQKKTGLTFQEAFDKADEKRKKGYKKVAHFSEDLAIFESGVLEKKIPQSKIVEKDTKVKMRVKI